MKLTFSLGEEREFSEARAWLGDSFESWLREERQIPAEVAEEMAIDIAFAIDWKWSEGGGNLADWQVLNFEELLLGWCPLKLRGSFEDWATLPLSLAAFAEFMHAEHLLTPDSASVTDLAQAALDLTDEFADLMGGPALDDDLYSVLSSRAMPAIVLPGEDETAAAKAEAPILSMFAALAEFVGTGRKLTDKGNLTMADARILVERLGTGDMIDEVFGDRTYSRRSSAQLYYLRHTFAWAKKAGVVRVQHGKVVATKKGLVISTDPGAFYDRAVAALLDAGVLSTQRAGDRYLRWPEIERFLDQCAPLLLAVPYAAGGPVPLDSMVDIVTEAVLATYRFSGWTDDRVREQVNYDVIDIVDALARAGVVRRRDVDPIDPDKLFPGRRRTGGSVELTAAGVGTARALLVGIGYDAPVAGALADAPAAEMLGATDMDDASVVRADVKAWLAGRDPTEAAHELAAAADTFDDLHRANVAVIALGVMESDAAERELRALATGSRARGLARACLVDRYGDPPDSQFVADDLEPFIDVLAYRVIRDGPEAMVAALALAGTHEQQINVISRTWRSPSPATEMVLTALGAHPVKSVGKAARKAALQHRSWLASQQ